MNTIISDKIVYRNDFLNSYRRIGDQMELISSQIYLDKTFDYNDLIGPLPAGYEAISESKPETKISYEPEELFMEIIIPAHWVKSTRRMIKIKGWETKTIKYDYVNSQNIHFRFEKNIDTHACYNEKNETYTIPVSGVYFVRKEFKAGDIVNKPLEIKRELGL